MLSIVPQPDNPKWNQLQIKQGSNTVPAPDPQFPVETYGTAGTSQNNASIAMTPSGNYVMVWTQDTTDSTGYYSSNQNIYYRTFNESTDTAGPQVASWAAPDSTSDDKIVDQDARVSTANGVQNIVISFDENMLVYDDATLNAAKAQRNAYVAAGKAVPGSVTQILDSVTNTENYVLLLNGVQVPGAIVSIKYGMNKAADLAQMAIDDSADYGMYSDLSTLPSNHFEAVLTIDGDLSASGLQMLAAGNYTIEALVPQAATISNPNGRTGLRDAAGNALGLNGFQPNGQNYTVSFTLFTAAGTGSGSGAPLTGIEDPGERRHARRRANYRRPERRRHRRHRHRPRLQPKDRGRRPQRRFRRRLDQLRPRRPERSQQHGCLHAALSPRQHAIDRRNARQHLHQGRPDSTADCHGRRRRLCGHLGQPG